MQTTNNKTLTVCSFFSGGGQLDYAFKDDFNIIWANELNPFAAASYRANIADHIVVGDIQEIAKDMANIPQADVYIGGPPCTDYSSDGANRGEAGKTGGLVWTYQTIIEKNKPKAFVFENVVGLTTKRHKDTLDRLLAEFEAIGYQVSVEILDASLYGTPQARKRVFIVGIRNDLGIAFSFPKGTHPKVTVEEALKGLPTPETIGARERVLGAFPNHTATWTNPTPERIADIAINPRPNQRTGLRRFTWEEPAYTLTAHIAKDGREFLHPSENRRLTVRESLRIMGMPDSYIIPAEIPLSQQYLLVGNGVAYQVGKALSEALKEQLLSVEQAVSKTSKILEKERKSIIFEQLTFDDFLEVC